MTRVHSLERPEARLAWWLLLVGAALWCIAIVAAPVFGFESVYAFFSAICHQNPERTWFVGGSPLAVCVRCASIYLGFLLALTLRIPANYRFLKIALVATLVEFCCAMAGLDSEAVRSATGLALGLSAAGFVEAGSSELLLNRSGRFQERTGL